LLTGRNFEGKKNTKQGLVLRRQKYYKECFRVKVLEIRADRKPQHYVGRNKEPGNMGEEK
jgi:hypothetical protein